MAVVSSSMVLTKNPSIQLSSASSLKKPDLFQGKIKSFSLSLDLNCPGRLQFSPTRRSLKIQATYSDGGRQSNANIFIGGFVLGGLIVGTLGCVYAPQISKALAVAGADRKELMKKLPKFIYDEEKALEKTRKVLTEKIAQLNSAIDDVSAQLRTEESPNGVPLSSDEIEAAI